MTFVDEGLIVVRRAVGFVRCEVEVGIVAPGDVAVELVDGKELHGVDAHLAQVRNLLHGLAHGAVALGLPFGAREVAQQQFVDEELARRNALEVFHLPVIFVEVVVEDGQGHCGNFVEGILRHVGVHFGGDIAVVVGVEHEARIGVAHALLSVDDVIVDVVLPFREVRDRNPEVAHALVVLVGHGVVVRDGIVVPVAHYDGAEFFGRREAEGDGTVAVAHRAHLGHAAGIVGLRRLFRNHVAQRRGNSFASYLGGAGDGIVAGLGECIAAGEFGGAAGGGYTVAVDGKRQFARVGAIVVEADGGVIGVDDVAAVRR